MAKLEPKKSAHEAAERPAAAHKPGLIIYRKEEIWVYDPNNVKAGQASEIVERAKLQLPEGARIIVKHQVDLQNVRVEVLIPLGNP